MVNNLFRSLLLVAGLALSPYVIPAQDLKPVLSPALDTATPIPSRHHPVLVTPVSSNPAESSDSLVKSTPAERRKVHKHYDVLEERLLDSIKAVKRQRVLSDTTGTKPSESGENQKLAVAVAEVNRNFEGNIYNGWRPPDNAMAISNGGWIVSVVNSSISFTDENGNITLNSIDLDDFYAGLNLPSYFYDPRVLYDPVANRFILVCLNETTPAKSKVIVSFSKTSNPNNGWWNYVYNGNFANTNAWFDYPQIGVSTEDLYIAGNLFDANDLFNQSVIMQMDKELGYAGAPMGFTYWNNITNASGAKIGSIKPVSHGFGVGYGPGIYLIQSGVSSGSSITLLDITADFGNSPQLQKYNVPCPAFSIGSDAEQQSSSKLLDVGECRVQMAYFANNIIHYVHHDEYQSNGYNGIRYGRLNTGNLSIAAQTFGQEGYSYTYPVVAPFSTAQTSGDAVIGFTRSADNIYPQFRAVTVDATLAFSSSFAVKNGNSPIDVSNDAIQRWGDYRASAVATTPLFPPSGFSGATAKTTITATGSPRSSRKAMAATTMAATRLPPSPAATRSPALPPAPNRTCPTATRN